MDLYELHEAIKHVQKKFPCPNCKKRLPIYEHAIVMAADHSVLLAQYCRHCRMEAIVAVQIRHINDRELEMDVLYGEEAITMNDVLDIRNALKNFDGDFKSLFARHGKK